MIGVATGPVPAEVIQHLAFGDWTAEVFVDHPVGHLHLSVHGNFAVSVPGSGVLGFPQPTISGQNTKFFPDSWGQKVGIWDSGGRHVDVSPLFVLRLPQHNAVFLGESKGWKGHFRRFPDISEGKIRGWECRFGLKRRKNGEKCPRSLRIFMDGLRIKFAGRVSRGAILYDISGITRRFSSYRERGELWGSVWGKCCVLQPAQQTPPYICTLFFSSSSSSSKYIKGVTSQWWCGFAGLGMNFRIEFQV